MSSLKQFKNKMPMHQQKKSFLTVIIFGTLILTPVIFFYPFQVIPFDDCDLPTIYITTKENIEKDEYVNCIFNFDHKPISAKIRIRGATNSNRPKVGYRVELSEQKSLLGMRKDDDWQLFAMYMDFTRTRIKLSFDTWRRLQEDDPNGILPDSRYIRLYLNGENQGLYLLAEKNDRKLFGLDRAQNNIDSSFIFQAITHIDFTEYENDDWEQDLPKEEDFFIEKKILSDLFSFINDAPDTEFFDEKNGIYSKFNKQNLIDFYLFNYFIYHQDFWNKNLFIIRNTAPSKLFLVPWDFDGSFGQYGWITYDDDLCQDSEIKQRNGLYERLLNNSEFIGDCCERWIELRKKLWTDDFFSDQLSDYYEEIEDLLELDTSMWRPETVDEEPENRFPDKYIYSTKEFDLDEYIDHLFEWIENRLEYCDTKFS